MRVGRSPYCAVSTPYGPTSPAVGDSYVAVAFEDIYRDHVVRVRAALLNKPQNSVGYVCKHWDLFVAGALDGEIYSKHICSGSGSASTSGSGS